MAAELSFAELYADLVAAHTEILPEHYVTLVQFRRDTGLTARVAATRLNDAVEAGRMCTRLATINGRRVRIWWFACSGIPGERT